MALLRLPRAQDLEAMEREDAESRMRERWAREDKSMMDRESRDLDGVRDRTRRSFADLHKKHVLARQHLAHRREVALLALSKQHRLERRDLERCLRIGPLHIAPGLDGGDKKSKPDDRLWAMTTVKPDEPFR